MSLPDSLPWMESVDAKMARAKEHLDTLYAEAGVYFESTKRNFILKSNGLEAWIVHYIEGSIPPIHFRHPVGQCVFNIRSALDNLVCGLIRTVDSLSPCKGTQFPICSGPPEQWESKRQADGSSGSWRDRFELSLGVRGGTKHWASQMFAAKCRS